MAQQTAVEWFYQRIMAKDIKAVYEEAKAMEKEQITDSYIMGSYDMAAKEFRPEQYYNEVYGVEGSPDASSLNIKNK
jgi:hypothetical protein